MVHHLFVDLLPTVAENLFGERVDNIFDSHTPQDAFTQALNNFTALHQGFDINPHHGTTIIFEYHTVLGNIRQTTGQVARVRCFQGGIGQSLAGPVGRNKVLQHGQPFAEIGNNGSFDDLSGGFGHQSTHAGQLTHLVLASPGTGIGHHVNRVEAFFNYQFTFFILQRLALFACCRGYFHGFHHFVGHIIGRFGPNVHHLVVLLSLGNEPLGVLAAYFAHLFFSFFQDGLLAFRCDHGVNGYGQPALG